MTNKTLLDPSVIVSRATVEIAVQRLALGAAHGPRQKQTVKAWIEDGFLDISRMPVPVYRNGVQVVSSIYGPHRLPSDSFVNLRKRLREAGFVVTVDQYKTYLKWRV